VDCGEDPWLIGPRTIGRTRNASGCEGFQALHDYVSVISIQTAYSLRETLAMSFKIPIIAEG
jgi:hypothetical protein